MFNHFTTDDNIGPEGFREGFSCNIIQIESNHPISILSIYSMVCRRHFHDSIMEGAGSSKLKDSLAGAMLQHKGLTVNDRGIWNLMKHFRSIAITGLLGASTKLGAQVIYGCICHYRYLW